MDGLVYHIPFGQVLVLLVADPGLVAILYQVRDERIINVGDLDGLGVVIVLKIT